VAARLVPAAPWRRYSGFDPRSCFALRTGGLQADTGPLVRVIALRQYPVRLDTDRCPWRGASVTVR